MKNTRYITVAVLAFILIGSVKMTGCEQEDLNYFFDCANCLENIPDSADLIVTVTINDAHPFVPLTFYEGDYELGVVDYRDTARTAEHFLYSKVGMDYSVMATYYTEEDTVFVVDGDRMRVVNGEEDCYPPCYYVRGGTLDLTLK